LVFLERAYLEIFKTGLLTVGQWWVRNLLTLRPMKKKKKKWMMIKTVGLPNDVIFRERVKCRLPVENEGQL